MIQPMMRLPPLPVNLPRLLADVERAYVEAALMEANGVKADAARLLAVNRTTFVEKLRRLGLLGGKGDGG